MWIEILEVATDQILGRSGEAIGQRNPELLAFKEGVENLEGQVEGEIKAALVAGLNLLSMGKFRPALEAFVKAEARDNRHGAIPKFLVSMTLLRTGNRETASKKLFEVLQINPFVLPQELLRSDLCRKAAESASNRLPLTPWVVRINDGGRLRDTTASRRSLAQPWGNCAIRAVSTGGVVLADRARIVVLFTNPPNDFRNTEPIDRVNQLKRDWALMAIDASNGEILWSKILGTYDDQEIRLVLTTPQYAVVRSFESTGLTKTGSKRYHPKFHMLLNMQNGTISTEMSPQYYGAIFFRPHAPGHDSDASAESFHIDFANETLWLKEKMDERQKNRYKVTPNALDTSDGYGIRRAIEKTVYSPFGWNPLRVVARNSWLLSRREKRFFGLRYNQMDSVTCRTEILREH